MTVYDSFSEEMTFDIGKKLGEKADKGEIICLEGDLGVGKTVFTKGFAEGLNIEENIDSPTFTIVQEYTEGRLPLYHFDVYRIGDISELSDKKFVKHPLEVVSVGDIVDVKVIGVDIPKKRISLSIKQAKG